jgi:hypothetical protein
VAVDGNQVTLDGERLEIINSLQSSGEAEAPQLPKGTWLEVWRLPSGVFVGAKAEDVDGAREAKAARDEAVHDARHGHEERLRIQARAFNASLQIPARWVPGVIADSSGSHLRVTAHDLQECDIHVLLKQEIRDGRLIRKPADLLCRRSVGLGSGHRLTVRPIDGAKVTCKECLALAKRWRIDNGN